MNQGGKDPDAVSLKSNPAHNMAIQSSIAKSVAEHSSIFANAVGLGSPRLSYEAKAAEHLAMMYNTGNSTSKTL